MRGGERRFMKQVIGYFRPFPWHRIGAERTGYSKADKSIQSFTREQGLNVTRFFIETDDRTKRSLEDRLVGSQVLAELRATSARGIVVARLEHIFSSSAEALTSLERWMDEGISFHCVCFILDAPISLTPKGTRMSSRSLISGLADFQRRLDIDRTRQRIDSRKLRNAWTGRVPFGFQLVDGRLREDDNRIERIQQMKTARRKGRSYREIAVTQGISVGTAHRLVKTDLRRLRRIGNAPIPTSTGGQPDTAGTQAR